MIVYKKRCWGKISRRNKITVTREWGNLCFCLGEKDDVFRAKGVLVTFVNGVEGVVTWLSWILDA